MLGILAMYSVLVQGRIVKFSHALECMCRCLRHDVSEILPCHGADHLSACAFWRRLTLAARARIFVTTKFDEVCFTYIQRFYRSYRVFSSFGASLWAQNNCGCAGLSAE